MYIIFAIILFGFLIAIHEFGHFIVAKSCGVRVNEFSIGMGPQLWHHEGKETTYSLRLFPIGGYCAMEGEEEESSDNRSFGNAAGWKKVLILVAGTAFNFLAGILMILVVYSSAVGFSNTTVVGFMEHCPAAGENGLMEGDEIRSINGTAIYLYNDVSIVLAKANNEPVDVTVRRDGKTIHLSEVPLVLSEYTVDGQQVQRYGLYFGREDATVLSRLKYSWFTAVDFVRQVWWGLEQLFTGAVGMKDLSGPIGIVDTMSEVGKQSATMQDAVLNLMYLGSFIAINLAVMNLLPIPALDGGRIFFLLLNGVLGLLFRREIPAKYESYVHMAGMALLLALMLFVAVQDVTKLIG